MTLRKLTVLLGAPDLQNEAARALGGSSPENVVDAALEAERTPARRGILSLNRETPQPVHIASAYADGGATLARAG